MLFDPAGFHRLFTAAKAVEGVAGLSVFYALCITFADEARQEINARLGVVTVEKPPQDAGDPVLKMREASRALGISEHTAREWGRMGKLKVIRYGRSIRVRSSEVERLKAECERGHWPQESPAGEAHRGLARWSGGAPRAGVPGHPSRRARGPRVPRKG